ncbi:Ca2+-dependent phosphoinositide-specific phospholipase C [Hyphomonas pacifica]|uniref:PLC-like phosphodiesterase n=1 Tax=Hyphomonas pacifica TaxID=1280941 RepID=A0A062TVP7_9PROT|nr:Ca2+-dependent phosphoinositide-specific phospholipase C [Hyphomonas pacifica]KCZ52076.1 hypothetical protein HY2_09530 [Hyphomonas pacifica]RAN32320.1 hypothetical protein HY3_03065 [Hyphomonas pacifica]
MKSKLEYEHPPLDVQLDLGLRLLELDFYADPEGGLYEQPPNLKFLREGDPPPYSKTSINETGFKVMHIQGYDNYSHCLAFRDCLIALKQWSDQHPEHTLITVTLNLKDDHIFSGLLVPPNFDAELLADIDELLLEVFGPGRLLVPDDVRGDSDSLRQAILEKGWPRLADTQQKFMFVLDEDKPKASKVYRQGHPSLRGRVMFAQYPTTDDEASFMMFWDLFGHEEEIQKLVAQGFLVRVAADIGTKEARTNDKRRLRAAIDSGAQFISTDYYPGNISPFSTEYLASFQGGGILRCPNGSEPERRIDQINVH